MFIRLKIENEKNIIVIVYFSNEMYMQNGETIFFYIMVFNSIFKFCWISHLVHRKARHVKIEKIYIIWNLKLSIKLTVNQSQETKCYFGA